MFTLYIVSVSAKLYAYSNRADRNAQIKFTKFAAKRWRGEIAENRK